MAKPPATPPSGTKPGDEADKAADGEHARGGAEQEERTRDGSKGRPPGATR